MIKKFFIVAFLVVGLLINSQALAAKPKASSDISYIAPITLYWLAKSGVPEAMEYVQYINAEKILKPENISQYERVERINKIYQEIRYTSLNDYIESENYSNVLDLGCGVSPRCLNMARRGKNYVGTELADVVEVLNFYTPNFLKDDARKYVRFAVADIASREEMMNSAKSLNGKICIVEEGLLMYLSRDKQKAMLENIREILKEHGGAFVTSDFVAGKIFMDINRTIYGDEDAMVVAKETQKVYEDLSHIFFSETIFKTESEAVKFIEDAGLKVEMRPILTNPSKIISIRDLNRRDIESMNNLMQQKLLWVITVD